MGVGAANLGNKKSEQAISGSFVRALALDLVRFVLGATIGVKLGEKWVGRLTGSERFAPFQSLGRVFKQHGIPWVLENTCTSFLPKPTF